MTARAFIMPTIVVAVFLLLLASEPARAQLNKCVTAAGKVEYRDSPCEYSNQQRGMSGGTVSGVQALSAREIGRAKAMMAAEERRGPQAHVIGGTASGQPTAQEIKNLETSASSVTKGRKERDFLRAEVNRAKAAAAGHGTYTEQDKAELRDRQAAQSRIDASDRKAARRDAEDAHLRAGGAPQTTGIILDRQEEAARAAARRRAAAAGTGPLVNCDSAGCWDTSGNRYNRAAGAGNFSRQDGKFCQTVGERVQCH